jgi:hypothetical protein
LNLWLEQLDITWKYAGAVLLGSYPVYTFYGTGNALLFVGVGIFGPWLYYKTETIIWGTTDFVKWWEAQNPITTWLIEGGLVFGAGVVGTGALVWAESGLGFADFLENDTFLLGVAGSAIAAGVYLFATSNIGGGVFDIGKEIANLFR